MLNKIISSITLLVFLAASSVNAQVTYIHEDFQGSVAAESNPLGQITKRIHYEPYGEQRGTTLDNEAAHTGHIYDDDTGLSYMGSRYYDPTIGRFYSDDPVGFNQTKASSFNRYVYAYNNPYKFIDPNGEDAVVVVDGSNINITIPISYSGTGATQEAINGFNRGIENAWTGQFGRFSVTTTVVDHEVNGLLNKINVVDGTGRSNVVGKNSGTWYAKPQDMQGNVGAHEAGHLMGLKDRYNKRTGVPLPGYETNIMARIGGRVDSNDIVRIKTSETNDVSRKEHEDINYMPENTVDLSRSWWGNFREF